MPAAKSFNNIIIGQFALTGVPIRVYVQGRFLTITDPDDVENPLIGFGMDENGQMIQFDYTQVEKLSVAGNSVDIKTYNKGMETKFGADEEGGEKEGDKEEGEKEEKPKAAGDFDPTKEESVVREDLPVKLKDLVSTIDINDDHLSKVFADNHGLKDGSGGPSPAAGVELQTLDTADDEEIAGYEAVGGGDETEQDQKLNVKAGIPQTQDVHHDETLDDDPLEEISMNEIAKRFKKLLTEVDARLSNSQWEALENMNDWLPPSQEKEYLEIMDQGRAPAMINFLKKYADMKALNKYGVKSSDLKTLAGALMNEASQEEVDADIEGAEAAIEAAKAKAKAADAALKSIEKKSKDKIKSANAQPIEEDHHYTFGTGDIIKNINPKCKHFGSKGIVDKIMALPKEMGKVVVYTVTNNGKTFKSGDRLTKTADQLEKI